MCTLNLADKEALKDIYLSKEVSIEEILKLFKINKTEFYSILYGSDKDGYEKGGQTPYEAQREATQPQ